MTFKMRMARVKEQSRPELGIGSYYFKHPNALFEARTDLHEVYLDNPMFINSRQANMLVHRYQTDVLCEHERYAGAETLRHEVLRMGHDGIVAVGWPGHPEDVTAVDFRVKPAHKHSVEEIVMKELRDYLKDAERLDEARKRVEVLSDGEKTKKALYDLKRQLDAIDVLTDFKYVGRKADQPATAVFEVRDRAKFDALLEEVSAAHGIKLPLNG